MTFFLYPTCIQTRFDHTIGVTILVSQFFDSLYKKEENQRLMSSDDKRNLKLAAVLHDVGHGFFSHVSESIYKDIDYFKEEKEKFERTYGGADYKIKEHEFLSYKIVNSDPFIKFMDELSAKYRFTYKIEDISGFIVGKTKDEKKQFLSEIINGTLDVDKLDYMKRDSFFLGFNLPVEIEQIMYHTSIKTDKKPYKLTINFKGIHNI